MLIHNIQLNDIGIFFLPEHQYIKADLYMAGYKIFIQSKRKYKK